MNLLRKFCSKGANGKEAGIHGPFAVLPGHSLPLSGCQSVGEWRVDARELWDKVSVSGRNTLDPACHGAVGGRGGAQLWG